MPKKVENFRITIKKYESFALKKNYFCLFLIFVESL